MKKLKGIGCEGVNRRENKHVAATCEQRKGAFTSGSLARALSL